MIVPRGSDFSVQTLEGPRVMIVASDVPQQFGKLGESLNVHADLLFKTIADVSRPLFEIPLTSRDSNDRHIQVVAPDHSLQGREDLLGCEIACRPEEYTHPIVRRPEDTPFGQAGHSNVGVLTQR
jgi:hypothetical protein